MNTQIYERDERILSFVLDFERRAEEARKMRSRAPGPEVAEYLMGRATAFEETARVLRQSMYVEVAT